MAHLRFCFCCHSTLRHMSKHLILKSMPDFHTARMHTWKCTICAIMKVSRLPSNMVTSILNRTPGQMLHVDFPLLTYQVSVVLQDISLSLMIPLATCSLLRVETSLHH